MRRSLVLVVISVLLIGIAVTYTLTVARARPAIGEQLTLEPGRIYFLTADHHVAWVPRGDPGAVPVVGSTTCQRFSAVTSSAICLVATPGLAPTTDAVILDHRLRETRRLRLAGIPSRARVSVGGAMMAWTVFVTGDSYSQGGFSTWTGILDSRTGYPIINMENIQLYRDGERVHAPDVNFWGVSFAPDDNRFYATVATGGQTYLVEGDYAAWRARVLRSNVECPSLSPDGTRMVFKKKIGSQWRLHLLDLATMRETPLAEMSNVDDQVAWLDDSTVMYAKNGDVWAAPLTGTPHLLLKNASSPVAL
jgi:hypothetical protein